MSFIESLLTCYKKIFTYSDRASKSEFWWLTLYFIIITELGGLYGDYLHETLDTLTTPLGLLYLGKTTLTDFQRLVLASTLPFPSVEKIFLWLTPYLAIFFIVIWIITSLSWFAACVRRAHDMNKSAVWPTLIILIPSLGITFAYFSFFGFLILLIFLAKDGSKGRNRFGPKPKK